ncbi:MAG: hypothetical protein RL885_30425 [Planctomycetota bacterium]
MRVAFLAALTWVGLSLQTVFAGTVYVDVANPNCPGSGTPADPYCSIQDAIGAAAFGDTVLVAPGFYDENIDFLGKAITVRSDRGPKATILSGGHRGSVVSFFRRETGASVLEGFTIRDGTGTTIQDSLGRPILVGGGIVCLGSVPTIRNNIITANTCTSGTGSGGGLYASGAGSEISLFIVEENVFSNNSANGSGGGAWLSGMATARVVNNVFEDNLSDGTGTTSGGGLGATGGHVFIFSNVFRNNLAKSVNSFSTARGGGLYFSNGPATISHNWLVGNRLLGPGPVGGGVYISSNHDVELFDNTISDNRLGDGLGTQSSSGSFYSSSSPGSYAQNLIVWGNRPGAQQHDGDVNPTFSDIEGGLAGIGNINSNPRFLDSAGGDYRLACISPCVDAGALPPTGYIHWVFDIEGDRNAMDGDSDGSPDPDMGGDELDTLWQLLGAPIAGGPPVNFHAQSPPAEAGRLAFVFLSRSDGSISGGIPLPTTSERLGLAVDNIFGFWSATPSILRSVTLAACPGASAAAAQIPASAAGLELYFAGFSFDPVNGIVTSVTPTKRLLIQ